MDPGKLSEIHSLERWNARYRRGHTLVYFQTGRINSYIIYNFLPRTTQGYEQGCVAMRTGTLAGLWDLLPCKNTSKYICKHLAEGAVLTAPPPTQTPPKCEQGWNRIGTRNYCVKVEKELPQNIAANRTSGLSCQQSSLRRKIPMFKSFQNFFGFRQ